MGRFGAFIAGGLVGAAIALLYTPRTGEENRVLVNEKANEVLGDMQAWSAQAQVNAQRVYDDAAARGAEYVRGAQQRGQQFINDAQLRGGDIAREAQERHQQFVNEAQQRGQQVVDAASGYVRDAAEGVKPLINDNGEELRQKIDAARERIASQVAHNAAESQEAVKNIPVEGDDEYVPAWARSAREQERGSAE